MKTLFALIGSLSLSGSAVSPLINELDLTKTYSQEEEDSIVRNEAYESDLIEDSSLESNSDKGYYEVYRLYVDSRKKSNFPNETVWDSVYHGAKKDYVYHNTIKVVQRYDVTKHENSKKDFLEKYSHFEIKFDMGYNLWNSSKGWTFNFGYNLMLNQYEKIVPLTGGTNVTTLLSFSDKKHSNNEKVWLGVDEWWNGNDLNIDLKLYSSVHWAWGSLVEHAALIGTKNEKVSFVNKSSNYLEVENYYSVGVIDTEIKNNQKVDLGSATINNLAKHVKNKKEEKKFDYAKIYYLDALFNGNIYGSGMIGYSTIVIYPTGFKEVIEAANRFIQSGEEFKVQVSLTFRVISNQFYGEVDIKLGNKNIHIGKSNLTNWRKGMRVTYVYMYNSINFYGDK